MSLFPFIQEERHARGRGGEIPKGKSREIKNKK